MNKIEQIESEIRKFHKDWLAQYIAKVIEITYRVDGNPKVDSYQQFYNSCLDTIIYSKKEKKQIFNKVDDILTNKYRLLIVNKAFNDKHIYLVEIGKEV